MKKNQRAALLIALTEHLEKNDSWCGETHIQKTVYFLQELLNVPAELDFVLYKFGPFSFDLHDEITELQAKGFTKNKSRPYPYGPSITLGNRAELLKKEFPRTIKKYRPKIEFISERLGSKGVTELEKLATALFVTKTWGFDLEISKKTERLRELKPHIAFEDAQIALEDVNELAEEVKTKFGK